jgi:hypothetical protein
MPRWWVPARRALEASESATRQATEAAQRLGAQGSWGRYLESNAAAGLYHLGTWAEADRAARDLLGGAPGTAVRARALITKARVETGRGEFQDAETHFGRHARSCADATR